MLSVYLQLLLFFFFLALIITANLFELKKLEKNDDEKVIVKYFKQVERVGSLKPEQPFLHFGRKIFLGYYTFDFKGLIKSNYQQQ